LRRRRRNFANDFFDSFLTYDVKSQIFEFGIGRNSRSGHTQSFSPGMFLVVVNGSGQKQARKSPYRRNVDASASKASACDSARSLSAA
jgi:hypothetical protein